MRFSDMEFGFQAAFTAAWNAYRRNTTPIGSAIVTDTGELLVTGENCIYSSDSKGPISDHHLAHAEINAILQVNDGEHPNLGNYTLYATMEPCPFCIGAIAQGNIRKVKYASQDRLSGAAGLCEPIEGIIKQKIEIEGPYKPLQTLQVVLIIYRRLEKDFSHNGTFLDMYMDFCPEGVGLGRRLFSDMDFYDMVTREEEAEVVLDYILTYIADD